MLCFNPAKRLTASQCLQHPFFQCNDFIGLYSSKLLGSNKTTKQAVTVSRQNSRVSSAAIKDENKKKILTSGGSTKTISNTNQIITKKLTQINSDLADPVNSFNRIYGDKNKTSELTNSKSVKYKFDSFLNFKN